MYIWPHIFLGKWHSPNYYFGLQVLLYSKCRRNGSSGFRHSLSYAAFLSARNSSAAQLSSKQAFSFIYRLRKKMLTFNTSYRAILQFPFYNKYVLTFTALLYTSNWSFIVFTKYGLLKKQANKPDSQKLFLWTRRTHFACTSNNVGPVVLMR